MATMWMAPAATLAQEQRMAESQTQRQYQKESEAPPKASSMMLKGTVDYTTVPKGTPVKLKLATVPTHGMKLMDRDLDGNLLPAEVDQVITAKTTEDIFIDDNKVIPEGTIFHGKVSKIYPPRRVGRPGHLELSFDSLTTPDGKKFAFHAEADNFRPSTAKSKAKGLGIIAAHAAGGAIVGALVAYQLFGPEKTVAMHGYNIAGGAAAGALMATGYAIMRKGPKAVLEPGDDLNMAFDKELLMPIAQEPTVHKATISTNKPGIDVEILKSKLVKDGLDGHLMRLDLLISNETRRPLNSIDLYLEDSENNRYPICGGPEEFDEFLFRIEPTEQREVRVYFQVEWPKLKRSLVWLDHRTRQVCYREKCP